MPAARGMLERSCTRPPLSPPPSPARRDLRTAPFLVAAGGRQAVRGGRCGSCARPAARCPSTARCARAPACSRPASTPSWPARSRCSRCGATASTPRSCSPTSSCRCTRPGVGVDIVPGTGPVVAQPVRTAADLAAPAARSTPSRSAPVAEAVAPAAARAGRHPADRLRRRAVHARVLPRRGRAQPQPRAHQGADVLGDPDAVARAAGPPRRHHRHVPAGAGRAPGVDAVQLFDSWAGALSERDYRRFVLPHSRARARGRRRRRRAADPLRRRHRRAARRRWREAGADVVGVDWRVPLDEAARRIGRHAGAGQPRPGRAVRRPGRRRGRGAPRSSTSGGQAPGHVFNLGHGVLPDTDPDVLTRLVELVHSVARMTRRGSRSSGRASPGLGRPRTGCARCSGPTPRSRCWSSATASAACCAPSTSRAGPTTSAPRRSSRGGPRCPALLAELGLADRLVHPTAAHASIRAAGRTVALPGGTVLGVPTSAARLAGLLSDAGLAAVAAEPAPPAGLAPGGDVALGRLLRARFGDELADRLVDPLLGGVYAGRVDALGLRPTMPALAAALDAGAPRSPRPPTPHATAAVADGESRPLPSETETRRTARSPSGTGIAGSRRDRDSPCSAGCAAATACCSTPSPTPRRADLRLGTTVRGIEPSAAGLAAGARSDDRARGARGRRGGARRARAARSRGCSAGRPGGGGRGGGHRAGLVRRSSRWRFREDDVPALATSGALVAAG